MLESLRRVPFSEATERRVGFDHRCFLERAEVTGPENVLHFLDRDATVLTDFVHEKLQMGVQGFGISLPIREPDFNGFGGIDHPTGEAEFLGSSQSHASH